MAEISHFHTGVNNLFTTTSTGGEVPTGGSISGAFDGVVDEHDNVFGGGWSWVPDNMGPGSIQDENPDFVDWQISGYGITWNPNEQVYGVAGGR